jgi:DNA-binding NarL/FixJ family response regulator
MKEEPHEHTYGRNTCVSAQFSTNTAHDHVSPGGYRPALWIRIPYARRQWYRGHSQIRETSPDIRILIVTMLEDDSVFAAMRAGARGYVVKGAEPAEMLRAIRAVADGEAIFSPGIAERLIHYFTTPPAVVGDQPRRQQPLSFPT